MEFGQELLAFPFGEESRAFILERYFEKHPDVTAGDAWEHVYRLLLWVDPTTSLAHCYESDKSQPGRHWYGRSLAFHKFVAERLGVAPGELHRDIDFMFRWATRIMAVAMLKEQERRDRRAEVKRAPFGEEMPRPGENPELAAEVESILTQHFGAVPSTAVVSRILRIVTAAIAQENKRKNLVGEGFEDTLAEVIRRVDGGGPTRRVSAGVPPRSARLPHAGQERKRSPRGSLPRA